jgi:hypothetical protein
MMTAEPKRGTGPARAINLARIKTPAVQDDLRAILPEEINPRTGEIRPGFETRRSARMENAKRIKSLRRWIARQGLQTSTPRIAPAIYARRLVRQLRRQTLGNHHPSFASPTFMRHFRLRFCGAVLAMLRSVPDHKIGFYSQMRSLKRWRSNHITTSA